MIVLLVSVFGGLGAVARFVSDGLIRTVAGRNFPWATMIINVVGSFILGYIIGYALHHAGSMNMKIIVGMGFCGGYTTFSTACFESVRLLEERRYVAFWFQLLGTLLLCIAVAMMGIAVAS